MTDGGVPHDDMLKFPWRSRMDLPPLGDEALDALLANDLGPGETTVPLRPVAEVLAALRAAPARGELTGLDQALAEFRGVGGTQAEFRGAGGAQAEFGGAGGTPAEAHRTVPRQPRREVGAARRGAGLRRTVLGVKLAAAAAVAVLAGGVAAAYDDALPPALQRIAHMSIAAPAVRATPAARSSHPAPSGHVRSSRATPVPHRTHQPSAPVGPNPAGPAAHGLCTAYDNAQAHGSPAQQAVAFTKLAAQAGGAAKVAAYCATVPEPGASPPGQPASQGNGNGNATSAPTAAPDHTPPGKQKGKAAAQ